MPILTREAASIPLPRMHRVSQNFKTDCLADPAAAARRAVMDAASALPAPQRAAVAPKVAVATKVAVAVGSRGIRNLAEIARATVDALKAAGAEPFIVAAMGSHGGGTAEGQRAVLAGYGVTEEAMGVPIDCSMDTVELGRTAGGFPVLFSAAAARADAVVPIARIKPHTDFRGPVESGLCKMLAIGLGKHSGCSRLHKEGFERFSTLIPETARRILGAVRVPFGLAIVENAYDQTCLVEAVSGDKFHAREPELLAIAKERMPRICLPEIDVLVIEKIGKDISGAGMDPNIVGRTTKGILPGYDGPAIARIVVKDVTEASHGNAIGIGLADYTVESILPRIDRVATFANAIASGNPESARLPIALGSEDEAVRAALSCCPLADPAAPRIVRIRSTLELGEIEVSEALLETAKKDARLVVL